MNRTNLWIILLTTTATLLAAAHLLTPRQARAEEAVKDRDYQVVTAGVSTGSDALYILDNRTGQIAVFTYDPSAKRAVARQVRPIADAFAPPR